MEEINPSEQKKEENSTELDKLDKLDKSNKSDKPSFGFKDRIKIKLIEFISKVKSQKNAQAAIAVKKYIVVKGSALRELSDLIPSLVSYDRPTRFMTLIFFISLFGSFFVAGSMLKHFWAAKKQAIIAKAQLQRKKLKEMMQKESDEARRRASMLQVGKFTLEINPPPNQPEVRNRLDLAEVELVVLCDRAETKDYVQDNLVQMRNQITNVFTAFGRDELLSREGKRRLKALLIRKLNDWLAKGRIEDIYFSKLVIN